MDIMNETPKTTIQNIQEIDDDSIYILHTSKSFNFEITKKAYLKLSKREQKNLDKLASHNFVIERK